MSTHCPICYEEFTPENPRRFHYECEIDDLRTALAQAQEENGRYKAALLKIGGPLDWHIENYPHEVRYCVETARAALGEKG